MNISKEHVDSDILIKIMEIDDVFYSESITPFSWYDRYYGNDVILLRNEHSEIVGYLMLVGIEEKLYNAFYNKILIGDVSINPKMFNYKSNFKYLASIVISDKYRNKGYGTKLLKYALDIQNEGIKIVSISVSDGGYNLLKKEMNYVDNIDSETKLFDFSK